jgi:hypothetical protein
MKFFSFLLDPTKKSVKIPNSKLKYAFYCPLNGPLDENLPIINKIKHPTKVLQLHAGVPHHKI